MKRVLSIASICLFLVSPGFAADVIGLSIPMADRYKAVSQRIEFGAQMAIERLNKSGRDVELVVVDDGCDDKTVAETANKFLEANAKIVVGPVCFTVASLLARKLNTEDGSTPTIPVVALNTRNNLLKRLREVDELPIHSLSNAPDAEARAIVELLLPKFGGRPFAIIDDGSVYGRALSDNIRLIGDELGQKAITSVNFRPLQSNQTSLLRRLRKSGVEALFIAASAEDVVTIANDMATLGLDWAIGTGERGELLPYVATNPDALRGLMMVKEKSVGTNVTEEDEESDSNVLLGSTLIEIAEQAISRGLTDLSNQTFNTGVGDVSFNKTGRASPAPFELQQWQDGEFISQTGG